MCSTWCNGRKILVLPGVPEQVLKAPKLQAPPHQYSSDINTSLQSWGEGQELQCIPAYNGALIEVSEGQVRNACS